ncbi:MAG: hypothetical protein ACI875_000613, partial [Planctomycetota bacterium]
MQTQPRIQAKCMKIERFFVMVVRRIVANIST